MAGPQAPRRMVRVERQRLKFAAAHMATFGDSIEPLHGHNYAVSLEVEGNLSDIGWVVDFGVLKRIGRDICERLDHHFLLQRASHLMQMRREPDSWVVAFAGKTYVFPAVDVFELPIANTTAELLADWFWHEVVAALIADNLQTVRHLTVGVEEAPGQTGYYTSTVPWE